MFMVTMSNATRATAAQQYERDLRAAIQLALGSQQLSRAQLERIVRAWQDTAQRKRLSRQQVLSEILDHSIMGLGAQGEMDSMLRHARAATGEHTFSRAFIRDALDQYHSEQQQQEPPKPRRRASGAKQAQQQQPRQRAEPPKPRRRASGAKQAPQQEPRRRASGAKQQQPSRGRVSQVGRGGHTRGWADAAPRSRSARRALLDRCGEQCFLDAANLRFPVCAALDPNDAGGACQLDCRGLLTAKARARQYKYEREAREADRLGARLQCAWASAPAQSTTRRRSKRAQ